MQPAIVGTFLTVLGASLLAIPLGVMGAVYLNEYGKNGRLARFIRFMTDVMVGVPSVVMGVFIYSIWVVRFGTAGKSAFAASLALGCLMLPIVVRSTEEMLKLVPDSLREASAALGTRTWKTTVTVVLPAAIAGITSGCLLAVARAAGETAPVLFTIGFVTTTNWSFFGQNTTLSAQIYSQLQNGGDDRDAARLGCSRYPRGDRPGPDARSPRHQSQVRDRAGMRKGPTAPMSEPEPDQEPRSMSPDPSPTDVAPQRGHRAGRAPADALADRAARVRRRHRLAPHGIRRRAVATRPSARSCSTSRT